MCGLAIEIQDNEVLSIKGDRQDPFSKGHICPKAVGLQDLYKDADRLKRPVQKINGAWHEITWEKAFAVVCEKLKQIQIDHGNDAIGLYQGNPSVHNLGHMLFGPTFAKLLKTKNKYSATSVDQLPHHFVSQNMFGHMMLIPIPDLDRTDFLLVLGANPMISNGSLMSCAGFPARLKSLQSRGGKMVVVDPRYTETAARSDQHLFIQPGTDALLLLEILRTLVIEDELTPAPPLLEMMSGWAKLLELLEELPSDLSGPTGINLVTIKQLARDFAKAKTAVFYGRMGASTQSFGSIVQWLGNVLNIITGNLDRPGGAMFPTPAVDIVKALGKYGTMNKQNRYFSRVRNLGEFYGELPVAALTEEIATPGPGQIKALITSAGNPVLSTPQGNQLAKALETLEFQVAIDIYINETTQHADIILPPATGLETDHYDLIFNNFAVRDFAKFSTALFPKEKGALYDWEIFKNLSQGMRQKPLPWWRGKLELWLNPRRMLDIALRLGPYGQLRTWKPGGLTLSRLMSRPHGMDLGSLKPGLPERLYTKDKKIALVPELLKNDLPRLFNSSFIDPGKKLVLIGRRQLRSNNSWMHNVPRLVKGPVRCTLIMHSKDAHARGLSNGQEVTVTSRIGSVKLPLEVSQHIMPGVVSIPHGWGHSNTTTLSTAMQHGGVSINDLTDPLQLDELSGNAAFSGVPVEVH